MDRGCFARAGVLIVLALVVAIAFAAGTATMSHADQTPIEAS